MKKHHTTQEFISCCAVCKRIKGKDGSWRKILESNLNQLNAKLTHGFCKKCYGEFIATIQ